MSLELNLEKIQEMKLPDYTKVFKKPMTWKKAKYVICMNDYKVGSKKGIVFIPYKKPAIAQKAFKKLKQEKIHLPNKSALCEFNLSKDKTELELVIKKGGLAPDLLQKKANVSYKVHNFNVTVKGASSNEELVGSVAPDQSVKEEKEEGGNSRDVITAARGAIDLFRNNLVPVLKSGKPDDKTESVLDDVSGKFSSFLDLFGTLGGGAQGRLAKLKSVIDQALPIIDRIKKLLAGETEGSTVMEVVDLIGDIMALAGDIRAVAGNVKSDKASGKDESFLTSVMDKIGSLQKMVGGSDNELTGDAAKKYGSIVGSMLPQVQELQKRVEQVAGSKSPDQLAASGDNAKDIVNNVTRKLKDFTSTIDQLEQDLKKAKSEAPKTPKGKGFLSLFS